MRYIEVRSVKPNKPEKEDLPKEFNLEDYLRSKPGIEIKKES